MSWQNFKLITIARSRTISVIIFSDIDDESRKSQENHTSEYSHRKDALRI